MYGWFTRICPTLYLNVSIMRLVQVCKRLKKACKYYTEAWKWPTFCWQCWSIYFFIMFVIVGILKHMSLNLVLKAKMSHNTWCHSICTPNANRDKHYFLLKIVCMSTLYDAAPPNSLQNDVVYTKTSVSETKLCDARERLRQVRC